MGKKKGKRNSDIILEPKSDNKTIQVISNITQKTSSRAESSSNWREKAHPLFNPENGLETKRQFKFRDGRVPSLSELCILYIGEHVQKLFFSKEAKQNGSIRYKVTKDMMDLIFQYTSYNGKLKFNQWDFFLHPYIGSLNFSKYGENVTDDTIEKWVLPNVKPMGEIVEDWEEIDRESIQQISQGILNLTHLSLSGCFKISQYMLTQILMQCNDLVHLDLSRCSQFKELIITCPNLTSLNVAHTSAELTLVCPRLRKLNISYWKESSLLPLDSCRELECLDMSNNNTRNWLTLVRILEPMAKNCKFLKELKLQDWIGLTDGDFARFFRSVKLNVTHLNLSGNNIGNEGLKALLQNWIHLKSLDLTFCPLVVVEQLEVDLYELNPRLQVKIGTSLPLSEPVLYWWKKSEFTLNDDDNNNNNNNNNNNDYEFEYEPLY